MRHTRNRERDKHFLIGLPEHRFLERHGSTRDFLAYEHGFFSAREARSIEPSVDGSPVNLTRLS